MRAAAASPLDWSRDGADWPHREASRFVDVAGPAGLRWHVQQFGPAPGRAPLALLLHGTGASSHSWRGLAPLLAPRYSVLVVDLPGHAFSGTPPPERQSLPGMAAALAALLQALGLVPGQVGLVLGHSAGAAIMLRLALDGQLGAARLFSVNGALLPLSGWAGSLFSPAARLLASATCVPRLFAWRASDPAVLRRLLAGTGSQLDERGTALYGQLVRSPAHAAGALAMMAHWDLRPLQAELPGLRLPLHLLVGSRDLTIPPAQAQRVMLSLPGARIATLHGLGHLAHEEQPALVARVVLGLASPEPVAPVGQR